VRECEEYEEYVGCEGVSGIRGVPGKAQSRPHSDPDPDHILLRQQE